MHPNFFFALFWLDLWVGVGGGGGGGGAQYKNVILPVLEFPL